MKLIKAFLLVCCLAVVCAFAATEETTYTKTSGGIQFSITYPSKITCGEPVEFKFSATGGSGSYKYRIYSLSEADNTTVYDTSMRNNGAYSDAASWSFTFYASGKYYIRFSIMDTQTYAYFSTGIYDMPIVIDDTDYPSVDSIVSDIASQCIAKGFATQYEQALWLHDKLLDTCVYDNSLSYCSAEGALARGTGTCESYHRALVKLYNAVGIETGRMTCSDHVWTAAKLDGEWTQIDATWDDPGYVSTIPNIDAQHLYFGLPDSIMTTVHSYTPQTAYASTGFENCYYAKSGLADSLAQKYKESANEYLKSGETEFSVEFTDLYSNVLGPITAYALSNSVFAGYAVGCEYADGLLNFTAVRRIPTKSDFTFVLPEEIKIVEDEAFKNASDITLLWIQDGCQSIGKGAFAAISGLIARVPSSVSYIGDGAFDVDALILCDEDSFAYSWAVQNGLDTIIEAKP